MPSSLRSCSGRSAYSVSPGASGVRLQGGMMMKSPSMGDDSGVKAPHVWANLLVLLLSIFLLAVLLLTVSSTIP